MRTSTIAVLGAVLLLLAVPFHPAQAGQWVILNSTNWASGDPGLILQKPYVSSPSLVIYSNTIGFDKLIFIGIPLSFPDGGPPPLIDAVAVCYKTSNPGTFISSTGVLTYVGPSGLFVIIEDTTTRASTTDQCYQVSSPPSLPTGGLFLRLRLNFANTAHFISIGVAAVHFQ